jgi:hypothetical protein
MAESLDQAAAEACGGLLILAGKIVLADRATDVLQNGERLARRMSAPNRLRAGGKRIRTAGPPVKEDGFFEATMIDFRPLLLRRIKRGGPAVRIRFPPAKSLLRTLNLLIRLS